MQEKNWWIGLKLNRMMSSEKNCLLRLFDKQEMFDEILARTIDIILQKPCKTTNFEIKRFFFWIEAEKLFKTGFYLLNAHILCIS